jgi:integrase
MKLIEMKDSPYWGGNIHVGYYPDGRKRYACRSSKVRRDPTAINDHGGREDRIQAMKVLTAMQDIANRAMEIRRERETVSVKERGEMLDQLLRACGLSVLPPAPPWDAFASEVIDRHTRDLALASRRSYWAKKSGFDKWLEKHDRLSPQSSLAEFRLADIQAFYDDWIAQGGQTTTANGALQGVSLVFEQAVIADFIAKNPCVGVKRRDNVQIPKQPFTLGDISALCRALVDHSQQIEHCDEWSLAIRFAIFTGAREGDCVSLRWSDFSDDCRSVRFVPSKKDRLHRLGKVDAAVSLMLPGFVAAEFCAARSRSASEFVTPSLREIRPGKRGLGGRFREIMDLAGIRYEIRAPKGDKGISQYSHGYHSFRHTVKTELRAGGVSSATSDLLTGHDDPKVAARYVHERAETVYRECEPVFAKFEQAMRG